ncbi:hypothetical protein ACIQMP_07525 [Streptomyces sp. NPDC091385]|uniref:hypothetical protein n=1 Tax=Streptomyces sp. NPDC091385 TaxID=3365997 RepID=UPI0038234616
MVHRTAPLVAPGWRPTADIPPVLMQRVTLPNLDSLTESHRAGRASVSVDTPR